jgi:hypothetical protein
MRREKSIFEQLALEGIAGGSAGERLDLLNELVHIVELPVN